MWSCLRWTGSSCAGGSSKTRARPVVPVLLASAVRTGKRNSLNALTAGADDYLEMPFRRQELLVKVARLTERHRVERHYREIVEQAADIIYTRDMDGHITSINEAGARFFGRPAAELVGRPLERPARRGGRRRGHRRGGSRRGRRSLTARSIVLKDAQGVERYLEGVITLVRDAQGEPVGVRGVVRDITERVQRRTGHARERRALPRAGRAIARRHLPHRASRRGAFSKPTRLIGTCSATAAEEIGRVDASTTWPRPTAKSSTRISAAFSPRSIASSASASTPPGRLAGGCRGQRQQHLVQRQGSSLRRRARHHRAQAGRRGPARERGAIPRAFRERQRLIYTHDLEGNFTSLNKTGERITGYTREEAARMNIAQVVVPEQLAKAPAR